MFLFFAFHLSFVCDDRNDTEEKPDLKSLKLRNGLGVEKSRVPGFTNEKIFLCDLLLHLTDISNPTKPWEIACKWGDYVFDEFFEQV